MEYELRMQLRFPLERDFEDITGPSTKKVAARMCEKRISTSDDISHPSA